jgi:hypothetical protein
MTDAAGASSAYKALSSFSSPSLHYHTNFSKHQNQRPKLVCENPRRPKRLRTTYTWLALWGEPGDPQIPDLPSDVWKKQQDLRIERKDIIRRSALCPKYLHGPAMTWKRRYKFAYDWAGTGLLPHNRLGLFAVSSTSARSCRTYIRSRSAAT